MIPARILKCLSSVGAAAFVLSLSCHAIELPSNLPPHPRLLFGKGDLPGIRDRAGGESRAPFQSLKTQADGWLKYEVKLPAKGGQWFHWYSCPKHGARLRTESPTRHVCPIDQEVFSGYPYDDVVISGEHNRLAGAIRTLGIVYQITNEPRYAGKAKEILLAYAAKYRDYPLHDIRGEAKIGGGKVGPQTLDESTWLITVVEGADCIWDTLNAEEQRAVKDGLLKPATDIIRQHKMGIHNIQCWKNSAVGLTGLLLGDMQLVDEALNSEAGYFRQMQKGVSADGPWYEGAWGYHFYTLSALIHLTEGAYHSGIDLYGPELKRMFDAPLAMAMPDLTLPAFNDSPAVDLTGSAALYQTAYARFKDHRQDAHATGAILRDHGQDAHATASYLLLAGRRESEMTLLHGGIHRGPTPEFEPVSANFVASGNAILAADRGREATWLCMKYGPHGGGHGHPDKLNFVLYGQGEVIAPDPGTANYGVPIQSGWYRTTLAHNTLVVDEQSQKPAEGKCEAFISTNGFSAIMASAGKIGEDVGFYRTLALIGTNLVVGVDQVSSSREHIFDLVYHNRGKLAAGPDASPFEPPRKPGYSYLRDTKSVTSTEGCNLRFDADGGKVVRWAMAAEENTTFITGTGVGRHTEDRVPLVISRRNAKRTAYLWCVCLAPNDQGLQLSSEKVQLTTGSEPDPGKVAAVRVSLGALTYIVVANPENQEVRIGDQQVRGRIAFCTETGQRQIRVRQVGGN